MSEQLTIDPTPQQDIPAPVQPESVANVLSPAETANYSGNWFNLQHARMQSPAFRGKFVAFVERHIGSLSTGHAESPLDKSENFQSHYQTQIEQFDANLERIYSQVGYGVATDVGGVSRTALGHGKIWQPGTVYTDSVTRVEEPLTDRQKDIVSGHEAYHGMVDTRGSAGAEVKSGFDWNAFNALIDSNEVNQPGYLREPDELLARMAQFKNYFGMSSDELFTAQHLNYVRQHYVEDTGLDNGVATLLGIVTPETEARFIELMNELPV
jgi:hypothetical protein